MINYEEELKKFKPSLDVDEAHLLPGPDRRDRYTERNAQGNIGK